MKHAGGILIACVGWMSIGIVGCTGDQETTQTRDFGGVVATSQQLESGDIQVGLFDQAGTELASLVWQEAAGKATLDLPGLMQVVFDEYPLTMDNADETLYTVWRTSAASSDSADDVAYDGCTTFEETGTFTQCCWSQMGSCTLVCCCGPWGCSCDCESGGGY